MFGSKRLHSNSSLHQTNAHAFFVYDLIYLFVQLCGFKKLCQCLQQNINHKGEPAHKL